jgi:hypothetical protein
VAIFNSAAVAIFISKCYDIFFSEIWSLIELKLNMSNHWKRVSDCYLSQKNQFFNYIMARTSYVSLEWDADVCFTLDQLFCRSLFVLLFFLFWPLSIYGFWLSLWYLQTLLSI